MVLLPAFVAVLAAALAAALLLVLLDVFFSAATEGTGSGWFFGLNGFAAAFLAEGAGVSAVGFFLLSVFFAAFSPLAQSSEDSMVLASISNSANLARRASPR
ncbi:hypothetical protein AT984_18500 [Paucibacter sp. KCTC 42545]|nr:hypothetical protein AT984_18500 [Paucibacter sp. KCTC 42545]